MNSSWVNGYKHSICKRERGESFIVFKNIPFNVQWNLYTKGQEHLLTKYINVRKINKRLRIILLYAEILTAKFRLKLKNERKTTESFRYDLNQILYDYTVEVTKRLKGLGLKYRVSEEIWMKICNTV